MTLDGASDRSGERAPVEPAVVLPWAAVLIVERYGADLARRAAALEAHPHPRSQLQGRQLRLSLQWLRRAHVQQLAQEGLRWGTSEGGSSELPMGSTPASSVTCPPESHLTVGAVAEKLGVGVRQVVNLCHGELSATKSGGRWWIDPESVEDLLLRRTV